MTVFFTEVFVALNVGEAKIIFNFFSPSLGSAGVLGGALPLVMVAMRLMIAAD